MNHWKYVILSFIFFLFVSSISRVSAQEQTMELLTPTPTVRTEEMTETKVEYTLPYPGMLPDHPLYNLKRVRDYILERLIADPVKKAEFYILQADKRLQMGVYLAAQGKNVLAESTISKGEKYLEKAQAILSGLAANGTLPAYVSEKYENSLLKHKEVVSQLMTTSQEPLRTGLTGSVTLIQKLLDDVRLLKK